MPLSLKNFKDVKNFLPDRLDDSGDYSFYDGVICCAVYTGIITIEERYDLWEIIDELARIMRDEKSKFDSV